MGCIYRAGNCKIHFKIIGQIIFKKEKKMTWQLMWRDIRATTLNTTFQLLVIYRLYQNYKLKFFVTVKKDNIPTKKTSDKTSKGGSKN